MELSIKESNTSRVQVVFDNGEKALFDLNRMYRNCDCKSPKGVAYESATKILNSRGMMCRKGENPYQKFANHFGCTITNAIKIVRGFVYNTRIKPVEKWVNRLCRGNNKGRFSWDSVYQLLERKHLIEKLENDGLDHLIPLILKCPADVDEPTHYLKKLFGKKLWKSLVNNSMTRNKYLTDSGRIHSIESCHYFPSTFLKLIPKRQLQYFVSHPIPEQVMKQIFNQNRVSNPVDRHRIVSQHQTTVDAMSMYERIHPESDVQKYFSKLSIKRVNELHSELTEQIELMKDVEAKTPIAWLEVFGDPVKEIDDYSCVLCNTKIDIKLEGKAMRHCVAMYADRVYAGNYLVVSIRKNGERVSTIGFSVNQTDGTITVQQHYGVCNSRVSDELVQVQKKLLKELQKHLKVPKED